MTALSSRYVRFAGMRRHLVVYFFLSLTGVLFAQATSLPADIDWLPGMQSKETFSASGLTRAEQQQVLKQVQDTSFDVPEAWLAELRVRSISLGSAAGLAVRGTKLLCGGTGNCQQWIFRRENSRWLNMFESQAPVVSGVGLVRQATAIKDLVVTANLSAERESWIRYRFDGTFYRRTECYQVDRGATGGRAQRTACPGGG